MVKANSAAGGDQPKREDGARLRRCHTDHERALRRRAPTGAQLEKRDGPQRGHADGPKT